MYSLMSRGRSLLYISFLDSGCWTVKAADAALQGGLDPQDLAVMVPRLRDSGTLVKVVGYAPGEGEPEEITVDPSLATFSDRASMFWHLVRGAGSSAAPHAAHRRHATGLRNQWRRVHVRTSLRSAARVPGRPQVRPLPPPIQRFARAAHAAGPALRYAQCTPAPWTLGRSRLGWKGTFG